MKYGLVYLPTAEFIRFDNGKESISNNDKCIFFTEDLKLISNLLNSKTSGIFPFIPHELKNQEYKYEKGSCEFLLKIQSYKYSGEQPKYLFEIVEVPDV